jgi:pectinesterase
VDFIFGNAAAVFDHTELHANGPGYLTAQSRTSPDQATGYVIIDSKVTSGIPEGAPRDTIGLGRPWRPFSRVVYIDTELPADIIPQGWNAWGRTNETPQAYYAEFESRGPGGPGANAAARVAWSHQLTAREAARYQPRVFLAGKDHWNPEAAAGRLP